MNEERLMARGKLAELELQAHDIRNKIETKRDAIRSECFPFKAIDEIQGDHVASLGIELAQDLITYREVKEQMAAIKKALGLA